MATKQPKTMGSQLAVLRDALAAKYPKYGASLAKPRTAAARKKALGPKVPTDLAALWDFCDGADAFFVSKEVSEMDLLSVEDAADAIAEMNELSVGFPKNGIPFATDGAGNYVFADEKGALFDWDHETRKATPIKKSLAALVAAVASAAKSGKFQDGPEVVARPNAALAKAMKQVESGASPFKVQSIAQKLGADEQIAIYEAMVARPNHDTAAYGHLALAYARGGRFADAVPAAKKGRHAHTSTLQELGEMALDAGAFGDAEAAFGAIEDPKVMSLVGLAIAQQKAGKDPNATLARATKANPPPNVDWESASSCYKYVAHEVGKALILAVAGELTAAKESLSAARTTVTQVKSKAVQRECDAMLANPADDAQWSATIARHAGLG